MGAKYTVRCKHCTRFCTRGAKACDACGFPIPAVVWENIARKEQIEAIEEQMRAPRPDLTELEAARVMSGLRSRQQSLILPPHVQSPPPTK